MQLNEYLYNMLWANHDDTIHTVSWIMEHVLNEEIWIVCNRRRSVEPLQTPNPHEESSIGAIKLDYTTVNSVAFVFVVV